MWVECNVLRQVAVFLRQCFADSVSRAILSNGKNKLSKLARGIVSTNINEVTGIKLGTNGTVNTLEDIVYLYVERETYKFQKLEEGIKKVDRELDSGFEGDKEKVEKFWKNTKNFMVERLCQKQRLKRDNVSDEKLLEWIESKVPELTVYDLPEYNRKRIENEEVLSQVEKSMKNVNASRTTDVFYSTNFFTKSPNKKPIYDEARDEVWKPMVWLHQKQLVDDFIFFTILHELCTSYKESIAFNLRQCFVNFIISNMPVLLTEETLKNKKYTTLGKKNKNWEQPLDIGWKMNTVVNNGYSYNDNLIDPPKRLDNEKAMFPSKEWKYLYKNQFDKILFPAAINNHYEYFKLYVGKSTNFDSL